MTNLPKNAQRQVATMSTPILFNPATPVSQTFLQIMGQNNSYYPPRALQDSNAFAFTPSILLRSDTNATKRSNYKSFLSMDANDPTAIPPPLPNLHNITTVTSSSQPQSTFSKRPRHTRAVSVSSSTWAPSMLQSPDHTHHSGKGGRQDLMTAGTPSTSEAASHSTRRSISVPARDDRQSTKSSDTPPRLDITLDPKLSRISFDPLAHEAASGRLAAALVSGVSGVSTTPTIPARPEYEPRVRSSLPPSSAASTFPPVPPRSVKRNMSVTSATTFASATPSQRSAIRRVRRNEALARLEGTHYDPAPASASFMPFGSDEEEEESEVDRSSSSHHHRDTISSSSAKSPPPIKPPSPLRYRNPEQRRFVEIDPPESLFELALSTIAEAPPTPQPAPQPAPPQPVQQTRAPSIHVHQSLWPALEDEDEENTSPFVSSYHNRQPSRQPTPYIHTPSRTPNAISPFSSRSNLTMHTSNNHSSTSLASFTPFSSTDYNRATTRPGSIHKSHTSKNTNAHAANGSTHSHSQSNSPYGRMTPAGSGPASSRSVSLRSNDLSDEYEDRPCLGKQPLLTFLYRGTMPGCASP
ncbi:hypothetical protein M408DRAFT_6316 [Serendipita vermifera MAFF 305830]|uniref:Uncharacterized protein n=1 Tax=Serendipita vermifera MAFF 305830 TaxID=933852 RepID=A0A0C3BN87_SERVB|nr:hypothetical protein M408DRAFT_6316 [Serendipita vermifera MAFF 305830]